MANMGYCRFENTAGGLEDCLEHIKDTMDIDSEDEIMARLKLLNLCADIFDVLEIDYSAGNFSDAIFNLS